MTVGMIASPSRPSVRFTALLVPTITKYVSAMKPHTPSGYDTVLKNGTMRSAFGGRLRLKPLCTQPMNIWKNLALSGADTEKVRKWGHDRLTTYGIGKDLTRPHWAN